VSKTMSAAAASADIVVRNLTAPAQTFYIDAVMISEGGDQLIYGDGNSEGWSWSGTVNNSTSLGASALQP